MSDSVFDIVDEMERIDALLEESSGELTDEIEEALSSVKGKFDDKVRKIGSYVLQLKAQQKVAQEEAARIKDLVKIRSNKTERIKNLLKFMLESTGRTRVETPIFNVTIVENSVPSIRWVGPKEEIPEAFLVTKHSFDSVVAKAYLKEHQKLPDGFEVDRGTHVRIK